VKSFGNLHRDRGGGSNWRQRGEDELEEKFSSNSFSSGAPGAGSRLSRTARRRPARRRRQDGKIPKSGGGAAGAARLLDVVHEDDSDDDNLDQDLMMWDDLGNRLGDGNTNNAGGNKNANNNANGNNNAAGNNNANGTNHPNARAAVDELLTLQISLETPIEDVRRRVIEYDRKQHLLPLIHQIMSGSAGAFGDGDDEGDDDCLGDSGADILEDMINSYSALNIEIL
jgi:hypothetical protein